jgi:hypothetical protein
MAPMRDGQNNKIVLSFSTLCRTTHRRVRLGTPPALIKANPDTLSGQVQSPNRYRHLFYLSLTKGDPK